MKNAVEGKQTSESMLAPVQDWGFPSGWYCWPWPMAQALKGDKKSQGRHFWWSLGLKSQTWGTVPRCQMALAALAGPEHRKKTPRHVDPQV